MKTDKIVSLSNIAAFINNPDTDPQIMSFEGNISTVDFKNVTLRFEGLMLLICTRGTGKISIDLEEYEIRPDSFIIIHPHNYVSVYDCSEDLTCRMLVCSIRTVEDILPRLSDLMPVVVLKRNTPVIHLDNDRSQWLQGIFRLINEKLEKGNTRFLMPKLHSIIQAVLYEVMDIKVEDSVTPRTLNSRKEELMARFLLAVVEECTRHRKVEYYADRLCISSKHLSAVVKKVTGQTPGSIIDRHVVLEAKVLLKNTDLTIQEISSRLNFPNQSFFGKYFKHATGFSPSDYRTQSSPK